MPLQGILSTCGRHMGRELSEFVSGCAFNLETYVSEKNNFISWEL